jgi:hypothetical protein
MADELRKGDYSYVVFKERLLPLPVDIRQYTPYTLAKPTMWNWLLRKYESIRHKLWERWSELHYEPHLKQYGIAHSTIIELISDCQKDTYRLWNARGGMVILGPRQLRDVKYQQFTQPFSIECKSLLSTANNDRLCNIRVCCLPWFDGVVIVPNDMIPAKEDN